MPKAAATVHPGRATSLDPCGQQHLLFNADLLALIQEFAVGFEPPKGLNGATGLPLAIEHGRKSGYRRKQHFQYPNGESKEQPIVTRRRNRPNPTRKSHPTKLFLANLFARLVVA